MNRSRIRTARSLFLVAFCLWLLPSAAEAATKTRECKSNPGHTLQHFLDELSPGDTLIVSGACTSVVIGEGFRNITIEGRGASIDGSATPTTSTVQIRGRGIIIKGFT